MVSNKSLDEVKIIAALLRDVHSSHGEVFNTSALRNTMRIVERRVSAEGISFLTKTMPRLCKAFDKAIAGGPSLNATEYGFASIYGTKLPRFLGEFFRTVLQSDGTLLAAPNATSVAVLRQILYLFYKYKLPYTDEQEQQVIQKFERTEDDLSTSITSIKNIETDLVRSNSITRRRRYKNAKTSLEVACVAKRLLSDLFSSFDPTDIYPRHGPGAVSTKEQYHEKYLWTNVSSRITEVYPLDAYFFASLGHFSDALPTLSRITEVDHPARVILVPKDSRGPRLISCEPVDFQWIQQGLGRRIVELVESHPLTKWNVNFTNQEPNRFAALYGSRVGRYATLDLNEASDRVSLELVRLLFPDHIVRYLEACRTTSTVLPDGKRLELKKFAPMGSCLCFPILALTVWAILTASAGDTYTRERILVYGDDVIVPTANAANAIEQLESFGLKVNRDKSCIAGLFRESCGMDAFNGINVTPVRIRTVLSSRPDPSVYQSYIRYANAFYDKGMFHTYDLIVSWLVSIYGSIPDESIPIPGDDKLRELPPNQKTIRTRYNRSLQKREWLVWTVRSPITKHEIDGWSMLLRYFSEAANDRNRFNVKDGNPNYVNRADRSLFIGTQLEDILSDIQEPFGASIYTKRRTSMLVRRWR